MTRLILWFDLIFSGIVQLVESRTVCCGCRNWSILNITLVQREFSSTGWGKCSLVAADWFVISVYLHLKEQICYFTPRKDTALLVHDWYPIWG